MLLILPLLLLAGMGVWVLIAERERAEAQVRRDAQALIERTAENLNGDSVDRMLERDAALIPQWQFEGAEPPAAGPLADRYEQARDRLNKRPGSAAGSGEDAKKVLEEFTREREEVGRQLLELRQNPEILTAVSRTGLPLKPLVSYAAFFDSIDGRIDICRDTLRQPSELTEKLVADALPAVPAVDQPRFRERTVRAMDLVRRLKEKRLQSSGPQDWLGDWHVESADAGLVRLLNVADVRYGLENSRTGRSWRPALPNGLGLTVAWHNRSVVDGPGEELAVTQSGPWRVAATLASHGAMRAESLRRIQWLAWLLGGAMVAMMLALWVAWRAFNKQAELARLQSEFVASVSHELRTPVASIGVLAERLEAGQADAEQTVQYHRFIAREGQRLAALVDNVLDFSRIEQGRKEYDFEHADLPRLIRDTTALLRPRAEEKGLTLHDEIHDVSEDRWPLVDTLAIRQALVNLIDNAIKFTPSGGRVRVIFGSAGGHIFIRVSDTGIGIPKSDHGRIYERFHRVDNGLRRETTGAGIGLSLVKHIIEAHGGRVELKSVVGEGAEFTLVFCGNVNGKAPNTKLASSKGEGTNY